MASRAAVHKVRKKAQSILLALSIARSGPKKAPLPQGTPSAGHEPATEPLPLTTSAARCIKPLVLKVTGCADLKGGEAARPVFALVELFKAPADADDDAKEDDAKQGLEHLERIFSGRTSSCADVRQPLWDESFETPAVDIDSTVLRVTARAPLWVVGPAVLLSGATHAHNMHAPLLRLVPMLCASLLCPL